jgi:putative transposase
VVALHQEKRLSVRRLAAAFQLPVSSVGRWLRPAITKAESPQRRPVATDATLRRAIETLCQHDRYRRYGYRRIQALLKRHYHLTVNHKTVYRVMAELGLAQPRIWKRPYRPKRVERMRPTRPHQNWQIDMTSFALNDLQRLYLTVVIDCYSRQIVGWTLDQRCRASEWVAALRQGLEGCALEGEACRQLTLRSDNGAQPCSQKFVAFLASCGIRGEYSGYDAPDDNAFVERVIRTIKEEEVWLNRYDSFAEARQAIASYINFYNHERIHQALNYQTPNEVAANDVQPHAA